MDKRKMGKISRARGARFEKKVREDLEDMGWIVDKWTNTVDYEKMKLVKVKNRFLGPGKPQMLGAGFPDYIAFKRNKEGGYEIIGVEVKSTGNLSQKEKGMCMWLIENKIFSKILIAKKTIEGRKIIVKYIDFREKHGKKFL